MTDWNAEFITDWREIGPEVPVSDSERAVEEWEEEFMEESTEMYERVSPEQYWARYRESSQDLCDPVMIHSLSHFEFDQL